MFLIQRRENQGFGEKCYYLDFCPRYDLSIVSGTIVFFSIISVQSPTAMYRSSDLQKADLFS